MSVAQIKFLQQALPDQLAVNQLEMSLARLDWIDQSVFVNQKAGTSTHFSEGLMEYCQLEKIRFNHGDHLHKVDSQEDLWRTSRNEFAIPLN